jgi:hypothetical protein
VLMLFFEPVAAILLGSLLILFYIYE